MTTLIAYEHNGQTFASTPAELVSELLYANYKANRDLAPLITPAQWATVFGDTTAMERRYQQEQHRDFS